MVAMLCWIIFASAMFFYVGAELIRKEFSAAASLGSGLGLLLAAVAVVLTMRGLKRVIREDRTHALGTYLGGGMLLKMAGAFLLGGILYLSQMGTAPGDPEVLAPDVALLSYVGVVFLGFAWQAKLVQDALARGNESETRDTAETQSGHRN